jgi:hypothetical protein
VFDVAVLRSGFARLLRGMSQEVGEGFSQGLDHSRTALPDGARANIMARGFVRGIDDEIAVGDTTEHVRGLARAVGREARLTATVIGREVRLTAAVVGVCAMVTFGFATWMRRMRA